jgi:hypothetical protein
MPRIFVGIATGAALLFAQDAAARDSFLERLFSDRPGQIDSGSYLAGDRVGFTLDRSGPNYLLRFDSSPEVFALSPDSAAMGGRVLRYDSGETAVQVSSWGGVTLYTDSQPSGLPAVRTGDSTIAEPASTSIAELENSAEDESADLARQRHLDVAFKADWNGLEGNASARALAIDAMNNVARGLERFGRSARRHDALARRVRTVMFMIAGRPAVTLNGKTLTVTFDPGQGYQGCASSRTIARALESLVPATQKPS